MAQRPSNAREALFAARVTAVAAVAPLLARLKLTRLERILEPKQATAIEDPPFDKVAGTVDWVLGAIPLIQRHCLTRGITMYYFLRREGADVRLAFGMGDTVNGLAGHCWIVKDGEPILEAKDPRPLFREMYTIPRDSAFEARR